MSKVINVAGEQVDFEMATMFMDTDILEQVHNDLAPCTDQKFFDEYCRRHREQTGKEFYLNEECPVY